MCNASLKVGSSRVFEVVALRSSTGACPSRKTMPEVNERLKEYPLRYMKIWKGFKKRLDAEAIKYHKLAKLYQKRSLKTQRSHTKFRRMSKDYRLKAIDAEKWVDTAEGHVCRRALQLLEEVQKHDSELRKHNQPYLDIYRTVATAVISALNATFSRLRLLRRKVSRV